ncbi:XkdQ/YqbQ family protein [Geosporobacter ferrireducens]|uniref:XkdQ/YqbQ family protein n=1 Tax=Geosporobacter ferrireducens TaxID=1424294 RepID=UPI00139B3F4B|nr:hydrolase [Geosporobacter ferrireducens]MTI56162.1 hydrolase [Geosporobacter ferrireducens]
MKCELYIQNGDKIYAPILEGSIQWDTSRRGSPGKLTFSVVKDEVINFQEGNPVIFKVDGVNIFYGFVFAKARDKDQLINVTAYDQIRYLKNKDTFRYDNKKANELINKIAADFHLQVGSLADTGYVIARRIEDNQTLMDIIYTALDLTVINTGKLYVLYDDFGKLTLRDVETMKVPIIVGDETAEDFSYQTDIDTDTYNRIKLIQEDKEKEISRSFVLEDKSTINQWGVLQYYEVVDEELNLAQIKAQADNLLKVKNRKNRSLELKNCMGDIRVRSGSSVMVALKDVGDVSIQQYLLVEKCSHVFSNSEHWMTLEVRGNVV